MCDNKVCEVPRLNYNIGMTKKPCTINQCPNLRHAHGLCHKHLWRLKHHNDVNHTKPKHIPKICSMDDCDGLAIGRGWCEKHYDRWRSHGDPNTLLMPMSKHGFSKTREYRIWSGMKARCNINSVNENKYHAKKGIAVCERWLHSFTNFLEDMGSMPTPRHTLDRMDSNGNYEPSNCRWATRTQQSINTNAYSSNSTGYRGVYKPRDKLKQKWYAGITLNGKTYWLGVFASANEAALAYNEAALKYHGEDAKLNNLIHQES